MACEPGDHTRVTTAVPGRPGWRSHTCTRCDLHVVTVTGAGDDRVITIEAADLPPLGEHPDPGPRHDPRARGAASARRAPTHDQ